MRKRYRVTWNIDTYAETPRVAALEAFDSMQDKGTDATVFEVVEMDENFREPIGDPVLVDVADD